MGGGDGHHDRAPSRPTRRCRCAEGWPRAPGCADRGREAWSLAPLAVIGLAYLLGRTDEFHLVPLAVVLPVMLAWAGAAARRRPRADRWSLWRWR